MVMEERRFDDVARALGTGLTRRGALAALGGIGLGTGMGAGRGASDARVRRSGGPAAAKKAKCLKDSPEGVCCTKDGTCTCTSPSFTPGSDPVANGAMLQQAIDQAPVGGGVRLAAGTYDAPVRVEDGGRLLSAFLIEKPLTLVRCGTGAVTLRGGSAVEDAENYGASTVIAYWESGKVRLSGLTVTTNAPEVLNTGIEGRGTGAASVMQIVDCTVEGNTDSGVQVLAGAFTIARSAIRDNVDTRFGGGGIRFGAEETAASSLTVIDTVIDGNATWSSEDSQSYAGLGGGIMAYGPLNGGSSSVTLRGVTISGNVAGPETPGSELAAGLGAGVMVADGSLALSGGTAIRNNTARAGRSGAVGAAGGGVFAARSAAPLGGKMSVKLASDSRIEGNTAEQGAEVPAGGGGIFFDAAEGAVIVAKLPAGTVTGNVPNDCEGAACGGSGSSVEGAARRTPRGGGARPPARR